MRQQIIAVVGPNASGKSALGIELALRAGGEIINCDSIQLYEGIAAATGAIPASEWRGVPHHLFGVIPPHVNYTAGDWANEAKSKILEIESRNKTAIIVGGTGFYLRALVRPLFSRPRTDLKLRSRLNEIRDQRGALYLHRLLQRVDPAEATQLTPNDWPRIQRALEIFFQTGETIAKPRSETSQVSEMSARMLVIAVSPPRSELYERINERVDVWFGSKLLSEVQALIDLGVQEDSNVLKALGYRHMLGYLQGVWSRVDAMNRMKIDTRRYAKRQVTWWRSWPNVRWIHRFGDDPETLSEATDCLQTS